MPEYYTAEDGTIHDREAERRARTQARSSSQTSVRTSADTAPPAGAGRKSLYWFLSLFAGTMAALYAYDLAKDEFTPPEHLNFIEEYVQQFVFEHAQLLLVALTLCFIYLYAAYFAPKHAYNFFAYLVTFILCFLAPSVSVLLLVAAPLLVVLALAVLVLAIVGIFSALS